MNKVTLIVIALVAGVAAAAAKPDLRGGAYPYAGPSDHITAEQRSRIHANIASSVALLSAQGRLSAVRAEQVRFEWPLASSVSLTDPGFYRLVNFVDQDPNYPGALLDYNCGDRTYDLVGYNHAGVDYSSWPFNRRNMDNDSVHIVAAAAGVIVLKDDGNFDRNCAFGGGDWNAVYVRHPDGSVAWYGHMKNGSLTAKNVGGSVNAGEFLGIMGSSGNSTGPHLHLEVYDANSNLVDPYAGPCNSLNGTSWWIDQRDYYDSAVNAVTTGFAFPDFTSCPLPEIPNTRRMFTADETVYLTTFYRDQLASQTSIYKIIRPDGSVFEEIPHNPPEPHYPASWWTLSSALTGEPTGTWTFSVQYEGVIVEANFEVVVEADGDGDALSDHLDNCITQSNPSQFDADGDGYGNACDADFNNDGIVNVADLGYMRAVFYSADDNADLDESGVVNVGDLARLKVMFFAPPGPSAFAPYSGSPTVPGW